MRSIEERKIFFLGGKEAYFLLKNRKQDEKMRARNIKINIFLLIECLYLFCINTGMSSYNYIKVIIVYCHIEIIHLFKFNISSI